MTSLTDTLLLAGAAATLIGWQNSRDSIYNVLFYADNSGSIDDVTDHNSQYSMPNQDPNFRGSNALIKSTNNIPPEPAPEWHPLDGERAMHPAGSSRLVTNFGIN